MLHVKRRGYQLQRFVIVTVGAFIVQDAYLIAYIVERGINTGIAGNVFYGYVLFTNLADGAFIGLLLLISAGYCITRNDLGPYKTKVLVIPGVYFAASLIADLIITAVNGSRTLDEGSELPSDVIDKFSAWGWLVLNVCEIAKLIALLLAIVYIIDTVAKERDLLEAPQEGIVGAAPADGGEAGAGSPGRPAAATGAGAAASKSNGAGPSGGGTAAGEQGHTVDLPQEVLLDNVVLSDVYAEVSGNDTDGPKTVEERLLHASKLRLLRYYIWAVSGYAVAYAAAILVPLFVLGEPGQEDLAVLVVSLLLDVVKWAFLAALCFIFRLRPDNPYLLLDEGGTTGLSSDADLTTELGVLAPEDTAEAEEFQRRRDGGGGGGAARGAGGLRGSPDPQRRRPDPAGPSAGGGIDHKFSLGDEEEGGTPPAPLPRGPARNLAPPPPSTVALPPPPPGGSTPAKARD
ncbi:hypothetical protein WJX81_000721 [Elliptochloris bilobata]|uniref:Uncharacterized protein n=1 Tax=Elliptochloris bilobata TaxID=381761 RepID=A0AAW1S308_9CHLO